MKLLRGVAFTLLFLFLAGLVGAAWVYKTARVEIVSVEAGGTSTGEDSEGFEEIRRSIEEGTYTGTLFGAPEEWGNPEDYLYLTYHIQVKNNSLIPMERLEVVLTPVQGDILQFLQEDSVTLQPGEETTLEITLLTLRQTHPIRSLTLTCYGWGRCVTLTKTAGAE